MVQKTLKHSVVIGHNTTGDLNISWVILLTIKLINKRLTQDKNKSTCRNNTTQHNVD
jgi:hypothetical protein